MRRRGRRTWLHWLRRIAWPIGEERELRLWARLLPWFPAYIGASAGLCLVLECLVPGRAPPSTARLLGCAAVMGLAWLYHHGTGATELVRLGTTDPPRRLPPPFPLPPPPRRRGRRPARSPASS